MKNSITYLDKAIYFSLIFIISTVPLSFKISNLGIIALALFWIIKKIVAKESIKSFKTKDGYNWMTLAFFSLFFWQAISLLYTSNLKVGFTNLESKLSFIIFPLILGDLTFKREQLISLVKYFIYSIAICNIFLISLSIIHYFQEGTFLIYHDFTEVLGFHAVFYSYCLYLSVLFIYFLFNRISNSIIEIALMTVSTVLAFAALVISASKNVLVVTILSIVSLAVFNLIKGRIKKKQLIASFGILLVCVITFSQSPVIKNRISELTQLSGIENLEKIKSGEVLTHEDRILFNGTSLRVVFWYLGFKKLNDNNRFVLGLSSGDRKDVMNEEFDKNGLNPAYKDYNLHNQYIQTFVELGLIGLLLYIGLNFVFFKIALADKNYILLLFMIAFTIFQMTESVLERNKGIVFFVFFLLFIQKLSLNPNEDRNIRN
ncbi:MAG: hypothetical protein DWP98_00460 [Bacteroidetes bacterium]|nr:MAG: hypothetical protein DWP98_00460 [Bacteroidota bacterium]MBL1143652.1 hypothetical protein [Bacteroidota bacterium]NOG56454.1 hypothetical protein [Bacteroidota bacterium]